MTPTMINGFATELVKTASRLDALKALAAGGKDKLITWASRHPTKAMAMGGAGVGAATSDEGHRLKGAITGGAFGALGGRLGESAVRQVALAKSMPRLLRMMERSTNPAHALYRGLNVVDKANKGRAMAGAAVGAGLGGLLGRGKEKTASGMMPMEQPAMGTGKGVKSDTVASKARAVGGAKGNSRQRFIASRNTKTAQEEGESDPQDAISEMLAQSQYQSEPQEPFWADQGATSQESGGDPSWGHGEGLKKSPPKPPSKPASTSAPRKAPPKPTPKAPKAPPKEAPKPTPAPVRMGPKMLAMKTAQQFFAGFGK